MTTTQMSEPRRVPTIEEFWEIFTKSQMESLARQEKWEKEWEARQEKWEKERIAREAQQANLEKARAAREANLEKARAAREAKLEKARAAREAKLEKERAALEAKLEKERAAQQEQLEKEQKERQEKWEKEREAREKENARSLAESRARLEKAERLMDRVAENVGGLNRSMGELIETLIAARLWEKFSDYPYNLKRAYQRIPVFNENNMIVTDIDILLSNTEWVMVVEVKRELKRKDDVDHHIVRMERIRKYPPLETIGKRMVGAMAGGVVEPEIRDYIHRAGFFVLELTGENVSLVKPAVEFTPREW